MYLDCLDIKRGMKVRYQYPKYGNSWDLHKHGKLEVNCIYTVRKVVVHSYSTDVWLDEVSGVFNSVIFEYPQPWKHLSYWQSKWWSIKQFFNRKVF